MPDTKRTEAPLADAELRELRSIIQQDRNTKFVWRFIRTHLPWVVAILGSLVTAVYWLLTHFTWTGGRGGQ